MNQTGGLKKRRKRNIAKVAGIGLIPYDESEDNFTGREMYNPSVSSSNNRGVSVFNYGYETKINMTSARVHANSGRATRQVGVGFHRGSRGEFNDDPNYIDSEEEETAVVGNFNFDGDNMHKPDPNHKRPYFLNQRTMNRLRQLLILGMTSGAFPWVWNKKTNKIDKFSPAKERVWYYFWGITTVQTVILTVYQIYSFFARQTAPKEGEQKSYREVFMMSFSFFWYTCAVVFNINMYYFKDHIRQYINSLLFMNHKFVERYVINADDYIDSGRILINVSIPSNTCQVFISVSLFLRLPFQPWFLYSYIYSPENPWYWLIPGALQEFMLVGQVITSYMLISWIIVAHTNSVSFWLREAHNHNDTGFTTDELRDPNHAMRTYRSLQILCTCFNDCMATLALPMVKIHIWAGIIPTGYVLLRSMNHLFIDEFPGILTYPCAVLDCVTGGFAILAVAAEMYDLGVSCLDSWGRTKQKDFRRILLSCPTLKVKVGRFYAITISTTITFFKSVIDYIIDCIITFP